MFVRDSGVGKAGSVHPSIAYRYFPNRVFTLFWVLTSFFHWQLNAQLISRAPIVQIVDSVKPQSETRRKDVLIHLIHKTAQITVVIEFGASTIIFLWIVTIKSSYSGLTSSFQALNPKMSDQLQKTRSPDGSCFRFSYTIAERWWGLGWVYR